MGRPRLGRGILSSGDASKPRVQRAACLASGREVLQVRHGVDHGGVGAGSGGQQEQDAEQHGPHRDPIRTGPGVSRGPGAVGAAAHWPGGGVVALGGPIRGSVGAVVAAGGPVGGTAIRSVGSALTGPLGAGVADPVGAMAPRSLGSAHGRVAWAVALDYLSTYDHSPTGAWFGHLASSHLCSQGVAEASRHAAGTPRHQAAARFNFLDPPLSHPGPGGDSAAWSDATNGGG